MIKYIIKGEDYNHCEVIIRQHKLNKSMVKKIIK